MTNDTPQMPQYGARQPYQTDDGSTVPAQLQPQGYAQQVVQAQAYGQQVPSAQAQPQMQPVVHMQQPQYAVGSPQYPVGQQAYYAAMQAGVPLEMPQQPQPVEVRKKRGAGFSIALIIALLAIIAAGCLAYLWWDSQQPKGRDPNGLIGQVDGKSQAEIQAELDRIIEEGMFQISIASEVTMENGASEAPLQIENVPGNRYLMQVSITQDGTGELLYESGILDPNYHIQTAPLLVDLDPGVYQATAVFRALDPETEDEVGQAVAQITIRVLA